MGIKQNHASSDPSLAYTFGKQPPHFNYFIIIYIIIYFIYYYYLYYIIIIILTQTFLIAVQYLLWLFQGFTLTIGGSKTC